MRGVPSGAPDAGEQVTTYQTMFLFHLKREFDRAQGFRFCVRLFSLAGAL